MDLELYPPDQRVAPTRLFPRLSPRERQTLGGLLEGLGEKQIACRLRLSPHTVHNYVKKLFVAYEVHSHVELMALFIPPAAYAYWTAHHRPQSARAFSA